MHYSLVFTGRIRDGATLAESRMNLAELFKISDPAVLDKVFSGKPAILRKNLSEDEAHKQEMILYMAGAVCELRNNAPPPPPPPVPALAPEPPAGPATVPAPAPAAAGLTMQVPTPAMPPPGLPAMAAPAPALAVAGGLSLAVERRTQPDTAIVPAALRGNQRDVDFEQRAADSAGKVQVTHHGRDGEALLDPMQAPWDPSFMPDGIKGLSWAGFMAPLLWGSFNGMRLSFLPLIGIRLFRHFVPAWAWGAFYLAFGGFYLVQGRRLAWENKTWRNGEHFNQIQRRWTIGSFAFFLLTAWGLVHLTVQEQRAERMVQALAALQVADAAVERAADAQTRTDAIAARAKAREAVLTSIDDPAVRDSERRDFAEQDREESERGGAAPETEPEPEAGQQPPS